ncbi:MAG: hypothetical protein IKY36_03765 [Bacteroidales bacterium]|nr:hypothetical protein [Bacteroidales bacterium]
MKQLYILLALLALCSCNQQKVISEAEYNDLIKELGWDQPDSLMTPEQLGIRQNTIQIAFTNTVVKNNEMRLTVDRDYFVKQGLPAICYDVIQFNYHTNNKVIKDLKKTEVGKMINIAEAFEEAKKEILNQK